MASAKQVCLLCDVVLGDWEAGAHPSRWPYGLESITASGDLAVFEPARARSFGAAGSVTARAMRPAYLLDRTVRPTLSLLPATRTADVVLAIFENSAGTYRRLAAYHSMPPLVVVSCWLAQSALSFGRGFRQLERLMRSVSALTVFSENQVPVISTAFGTSRQDIHVVPFGVEVDYYTPAGDDEGYVAVIGNDIGRDWTTLMAAASLTPEVEYRVGTTRGRMAGVAIPANVTMLGPLSHADYRDTIRRAAAVGVPSYPLAYPTGQSALLEGYACGRPGITARTAAMKSYALGDACLTYEPEDPVSLAAAVRELMASPRRRQEMGEAARRAAKDLFDSRAMWETIAGIVLSTAD